VRREERSQKLGLCGKIQMDSAANRLRRSDQVKFVAVFRRVAR
jgi:hypothetical protein